MTIKAKTIKLQLETIDFRFNVCVEKAFHKQRGENVRK